LHNLDHDKEPTRIQFMIHSLQHVKLLQKCISTTPELQHL